MMSIVEKAKKLHRKGVNEMSGQEKKEETFTLTSLTSGGGCPSTDDGREFCPAFNLLLCIYCILMMVVMTQIFQFPTAHNDCAAYETLRNGSAESDGMHTHPACTNCYR